MLAETSKKVQLTVVDPTVLTTAWRATDIIGADIYDDSSFKIGKVKDMLVVASGSIPFVIVDTLPGANGVSHSVVVAASDFELVGNKLTMHGGSPDVLMNAPNFK